MPNITINHAITCTNLLPLLQTVADEQRHYLVVPSVSTIKSPGELTLLDEKPLGATGRTNKFKHRGDFTPFITTYL